MATNQITNRGLVVSYDIGNTLSYPGTGTTITDLHKSGVNLTTVNGAPYSGGNWGYITTGGAGAGVFNAFVKSAVLNPPFGGQNVSYGIMFKIGSLGAGSTIPFSYYAGARADTDAISCYLTSTGAILFYFRDIFANTITFTTTGTYNDGSWHYAVASKNGQTINCYVDGAFVGTSTNSSFNSISFTATDYFGMGGDGSNTSQYFQGNIAALHYYFSSLTAEEVLLNYQYLIKRTLH